LAFVELEVWDAKRERRAGRGAQPAPPALLPHLTKSQDRTLRYGSAGLISACVHVLLLWVLATRLTGGLASEAFAEKTSQPMTLLDLAAAPSPPADASEPEKSTQAPSPQPEPRPVEVDRTIANEIPPPEWTIASLRAIPSQPGPPAQAASGALGAGASTGTGEAAYDPYAGAAPLRRPEPSAGGVIAVAQRLVGMAAAGPLSSAGLELDTGVLEQIRIAVARSLKGGHGSAELSVRVAPDGRVLEAIALGGTASPAAKAALQRALLGSRLYRRRAGGTGTESLMLRLPVLQLRV
jgi:hypothetical protein